MTPPRPTAPTAAEMREATIQMHCDSGGCDSVRGGPPGSHDSVGCHLAGMLDDLMAAARAEALEDAATLVEIYVGLSARAARVPRAIRAMVSK